MDRGALDDAELLGALQLAYDLLLPEARWNVANGTTDPVIRFLGTSRIIRQSYDERLAILVLNQSIEPPEHFVYQIKVVNRGKRYETKIIL